MTSRAIVLPSFALALLALTGSHPIARTPSWQAAGTTPPATALVERVGDTAFIQIQADSFRQLDARQQALAYWLAQASIAIDPIIYDQLSAFGLREKRLLEEIVARPAPVDPAAFTKIRAFALLFWANRGNHNENTTLKFLPTFTFEELKTAAARVQAAGGFKTKYGDLPALATADAVSKEVDALNGPLFDPNVEPSITAKTPPPGSDIVRASSNTFYQGVTLAELANLKERFPLNSRVVKGADGTIREDVYRAGTPDGKIAPGVYATYLRKANEYLAKAKAVADPAQAKVIGNLITFYQTGEPKDWLAFGASWVQNDAPVDFVNGFIEVYRDARGAKGSSQSFVSITNAPITVAMTTLAKNAAYFEDKAPWADAYKKKAFQPPVVKAVDVILETGDFHVTTIGDNLPNENEIHEKYGTKNFLFPGSSHALSRATGSKSAHEFAASPEVEARAGKVGEESEDLLTAHARSHRPRVGSAEREGQGRRRAVPEGVLLDARGSARGFDGIVERLGSEAEGAWAHQGSRRSRQGDVRQRRVGRVAPAAVDSARRHDQRGSRARPGADLELHQGHDRRDRVVRPRRQDLRARHGLPEDARGRRQAAGRADAHQGRRRLRGDQGARRQVRRALRSGGARSGRGAVQAARSANLLGGRQRRAVGGDRPKGAVTSVQSSYPRDAVRQYLNYGRMFDAGLVVK